MYLSLGIENVLRDFMLYKDKRGMYKRIPWFDVISFLVNAGLCSGLINLLRCEYGTILWFTAHRASLAQRNTVHYREQRLKETAVQTRINGNKLKVFVPGRASTAFHQPTARGRTSYVAISNRILLKYFSLYSKSNN